MAAGTVCFEMPSTENRRGVSSLSRPLQVKFALQIRLALSHHGILVKNNQGGRCRCALQGGSSLTSAQKGVRKRRRGNVHGKRGSNVF